MSWQVKIDLHWFVKFVNSSIKLEYKRYSCCLPRIRTPRASQYQLSWRGKLSQMCLGRSHLPGKVTTSAAGHVTSNLARIGKEQHRRSSHPASRSKTIRAAVMTMVSVKLVDGRRMVVADVMLT